MKTKYHSYFCIYLVKGSDRLEYTLYIYLFRTVKKANGSMKNVCKYLSIFLSTLYIYLLSWKCKPKRVKNHHSSSVIYGHFLYILLMFLFYSFLLSSTFSTGYQDFCDLIWFSINVEILYLFNFVCTRKIPNKYLTKTWHKKEISICKNLSFVEHFYLQPKSSIKQSLKKLAI